MITTSQKQIVDMACPGSRAMFDVRGIKSFSVSSPLAASIGAGVATIYRNIAGIDKAFSPSVNISASSKSVEQMDVRGVAHVSVVVTTAASVGDVAIAGYGEGGPRSLFKESKATIDLTNKGSRVVFDVRGVDVFSASTPMSSLMGSSVLTLHASIDGVDSAFSPSQVINSSTSSIIGQDVSGVDEVTLVVTTADSSAIEIPVNGYGEEASE